MENTKLALTLLLCYLLGGCAVGALPEQMTFKSEQPLGYDEALLGEISVSEVKGGQTTNPLWTSEIGGIGFHTALKESLKLQGLLAEEGRFQLNPTFVKVDQPFAGFDMTVSSEINYILIDTQTGQEVMNENIVSEHTSTVGDAFLGSARLQHANEGAARNNIQQLLNRLSELKLGGQVSLVF